MKKPPFSAPALVIIVAGVILTGLGLHALGFFNGSRGNSHILPLDRSSPENSGGTSIDENGSIVIPEPASSGPEAISGIDRREGVPQRPFQGVRGNVRDGLTGERPQAFTVHIFGSDEIDMVRKAGVDPGKVFRGTNGRLTLRDLDEGAYSLLIKCTGYQSLWVHDIRVPQKQPLIDFNLQRGTHITGRVIDTEGNAVAKMSVFIKCVPRNPDTPPPARRTAVTDRSGRFLFGDLVEGTYDVLLESLSDPLDNMTGVFLTEGGAFSKEFIVPLFNELDFRISAPNGKPLNDVSVRVSSGSRMFRTKTQHEGKAVLKRVPPGDYELVLAKSRFKIYRETVSIITLSGKMVFDRMLEFDI